MPATFADPWLGRIAGLGLAAFALGAVSAWSADRLVEHRPAIAPAAIIGLQAVLVLGAWAAAPSLHAAAASMILSAALLTLAVVDVTELRLPDVITLPLAIAGLAVSAAQGSGVLDHAVGALVGWAALAGLASGFRRVTGRHGLGMGDAKLLAAAGAWCGWEALPVIVLVACLGGFLWIGLRLARQGPASAGAPLPFGAPLALATWLVQLGAGRL